MKKSKENHSKNKITIDTEHDTLTELNGITPNDKAINLKGGILYKNNFSIDNWVIVDCNNRLILKCPHKLIKDKTTSSFFDNPRAIYLQEKCRDVTVDTRSFCGF